MTDLTRDRTTGLVRRVARLAVVPAGAILALALTTPAAGVASSAPSPPRIAAGFAHSCVLTSGNGVKCWGGNAYGEIGNGGGVLATALRPVNVSGLGSGVRAIAAGGQHSCALTRAGKVKCWGENRLGQLGRPSTANGRTPVPVDVSGLGSGITGIAAGGQYTCGLTSGGAVKCWGFNGQGQLGNGSRTPPSSSPLDVAGLASGVIAIGAGEDHACAVTGEGSVKCWGNNRGGELGNGARVDNYAPVDVVGLTSGVRAVDSGYYHTCALTSGGGVKCWGENAFGQLGNGARGQVLISTVPVDVVGLASGIAAISAGRGHTCVVTTGGGVKCWGDNTYGQLGNGSRTGSTTPVDVAGLSGVSAIAAGYNHTCALVRGGEVKCWGLNHGRLGNGSNEEFRTKPVKVRR